VVLRAMPRPDAFVAAVGAFTPRMLEWEPAICRRLAAEGTRWWSTPATPTTAGDLLRRASRWPRCPLADVLCDQAPWQGLAARARQGQGGRCSSRAAAGPAGIWPRHAARLPPPGADFHFLNLVFL
jgi:ornithine cyclodeaminase